MAETIEIPLSRGYIAIVDEVDADLAQYRWSAQVDPTGTVYAIAASKLPTTTHSRLMHRIVLSRKLDLRLTFAQKTDHRDGNGCHNTRDNLRLATNSQNMRNRKMSANNSSGITGVNWNEECKKWQARIFVDNHSYNLGFFHNIADAAAARAAAELLYFGEFSALLSRPATSTQEVTQ